MNAIKVFVTGEFGESRNCWDNKQPESISAKAKAIMIQAVNEAMELSVESLECSGGEQIIDCLRDAIIACTINYATGLAETLKTIH